MHVALDTTALDPTFRAHSVRGTGRYVSELYSRLPKLCGIDERVSEFQYSKVGRGGFLDNLVEYLPAGRTTVRHQLLYPLSLTQPELSDVELLHFPVHADAPTWCKKPFVVTVLDLIPLIFKDLYAPKKNDRRFQLARWLELKSITNAEAVFVISENTGLDVHRLLGVSMDKIVVTPLGVSPEFYERKPHGDLLRHRFDLMIDNPLVLYVGGIDQRKNIAFMLEAFSEVVQERTVRQQPLPYLVMAGDITPDEQYPLFKKEVERHGLTHLVKETGYVEDTELRAFYREADVFFYPSLYEGFGLPPLEAMASRTAVVCSDTSSLPEVVGDAALQFSPSDIEDASNKLLMALNCRDLRFRLEERGDERSRQFTWERTAELTIEGYRNTIEILRDKSARENAEQGASSSQLSSSDEHSIRIQ